MRITDVLSEKITGEWGIEPAMNKGVAILRTTNFTNLGKIDFSNVVYREIDEKKINQKRLKKGDIIIEKSGGSPKQPVGRVVFFDTEPEEIFLCNNFTTVLRPDRKKVYPKYLFYQLFIGHQRGKTLKYQNKTTGIINLKLEDYLKEKIFIPLVFADQIKIATILSQAEKLIAQRKQSIALLDEFLKSTFLEMFGDPVKNEKGWEKTNFKNVAKNENSKRVPIKESDRENREGIYPYYGATGIIDTIDDFKFEGEYLLIAEDGKNLLFRKRNNAFLASGKFWVNNHAHVLSSNGITNLKYLEYFLNSIDFGPYITGTDQIKLNKDNLERIPVPVPPIILQNQFAQLSEKIETIKTQYRSSLKELENLFGSLSQKAFKGELDLSKMELTYEEEYSVTDNDRTEESHFNKPINYDRVEVKPVEREPIRKEGKSIWDTTRTFSKVSNLEFNNIEGEAVLQKVFSKKTKGFRFQEFETFLKKEGFRMNYHAIKDFIIEKLQNKELVQYYGSEVWMQKNYKPQTSPAQDDFAGDGNIWLIHNGNKK